MILTPLIKRQLRIFAVLTAIALGMAVFVYARVPSMMGIGVYDVKVEYRDASGLYPKAMVTYRGVKIGRVQSLEVEGGGSVAVLRIDNDHKIPADAIAELHSTSAIGEQYVDLVSDGDATGDKLEDGSIIPADRTVEMPQITPVLNSLNDLLKSVPEEQTRQVLDETAEGFGGAGPDLGAVVDNTGLLVQEAQAQIDATTSLIQTLQPVLDTQEGLRDETLGYAGSLSEFSNELATRDQDLRALLAKGPAGLEEAQQLVRELQPTLPMLLQNLTTNAEVFNTYLPDIEQTLVVYPATIARLQSTVNPRAKQGDVQLDLRSTFNNPPTCHSGYLPTNDRRSPSDTSIRKVNTLAHCEIPDSDPTSVRGARNLPCPNSSARGPLPASCGLKFGSGVWPTNSRTIAYDIAMGDPQPGDEETTDGSSAKTTNSTGDDAWKILVLAPLEVGR